MTSRADGLVPSWVNLHSIRNTVEDAGSQAAAKLSNAATSARTTATSYYGRAVEVLSNCVSAVKSGACKAASAAKTAFTRDLPSASRRAVELAKARPGMTGAVILGVTAVLVAAYKYVWPALKTWNENRVARNEMRTELTNLLNAYKAEPSQENAEALGAKIKEAQGDSGERFDKIVQAIDTEFQILETQDKQDRDAE